MKNTLTAAAILASITLAVSAPAFAASANPFVDVPESHWAYDSVNKLAANGIVDGYGDGTFKGDKTITRYEMAQITAKALAKYEAASAEDKAVIDQLTKEFADELTNLGVRVAALEKTQSNIKITGETRLRYRNDDEDTVTGSNQFDMRQRLYLKAKVNDQVSYTGRLEATLKNGSDDSEVRYNQNYLTVTDFGVDKMLIGRVPLGVGMHLNASRPSDNDGIILVQKAGSITFTGFVLARGNNTQFNGIYASTDLNKNAAMAIGYTRGDQTPTSPEAKSFDIGAYTKIGDDFSLVGSYVDTNNTGDKDGNAWAVQLVKGLKTPMIGTVSTNFSIVDASKPHTDGFILGYRRVEKNGLWNQGDMVPFNPSFGGINITDDVKGIYLGYQNVLAENTILSLEYQDLKTTSTGSDKDKIFVSHVQFYF